MNNDPNSKEAILAGLEPLIQQAEREGKWLRCGYYDIRMPPAELRKAHAKGSFLWGVVNWDLIEVPEYTKVIISETAAPSSYYTTIVGIQSDGTKHELNFRGGIAEARRIMAICAEALDNYKAK